MLKPYRTIQDVLASHWVLSPSAERHQKTDRVLRSTKLESSIYHDLRTEDVAMDEIEQDAEKKLKSFSALSQDVFQSFYSLVPRRNEEASLSVAARKFNAPILEHMTKSEEYPTLKEVCEGRELPAYEAASEFVSKVSGELGDLLPQLAGKQGALHTLEKLESTVRWRLSQNLSMIVLCMAGKRRMRWYVKPWRTPRKRQRKCRVSSAHGAATLEISKERRKI